ncbi:50S ribosomal protein L13 [candidate division WWE3 bacterium]|nr:50S ribosomal protein L13 [candidate division WWE3 bacterium]
MRDRTTFLNPKKFKRSRVDIDAKGQVLGRIAASIARVLMGKSTPMYAPNADFGSRVVVTNASSVLVTGKKLSGKVYYHHTGFPGGIRSENLQDLIKRDPTQALRKAVFGMLPKNKLRKQRISNLYIFSGPATPLKNAKG